MKIIYRQARHSSPLHLELFLAHCILVDTSTVICWVSPFVILGVSGQFCHFYFIFAGKILLANTVDPDQRPHHVVSDLGLHYLPMTFYGFKGRNGLKDSSTVICWMSVFVILGMFGLYCHFYSIFDGKILLAKM